MIMTQFILSPYALTEPLPGLTSLARDDWQINQPPISAGGIFQQLTDLYRPLREWVADALKNNLRPICISGDCCTTLGVMAGIQQARIQPMVLWLDAHGDFNTPETSPSGFLGGMPLAMLVGRGDQTLMQAIGAAPIAESLVMLSDARDLDPAEGAALRASEVLHVPRTSDIIENPFLHGPVYVHFDVDIVCCDDVPAVRYPARGGIPAKDLQDVFRYLAQRHTIIAVSMGSWDPQKDIDGTSQRVCMDLLDTLCFRTSVPNY